jgi:hypothetical protein
MMQHDIRVSRSHLEWQQAVVPRWYEPVGIPEGDFPLHMRCPLQLR